MATSPSLTPLEEFEADLAAVADARKAYEGSDDVRWRAQQMGSIVLGLRELIAATQKLINANQIAHPAQKRTDTDKCIALEERVSVFTFTSNRVIEFSGVGWAPVIRETTENVLFWLLDDADKLLTEIHGIAEQHKGTEDELD